MAQIRLHRAERDPIRGQVEVAEHIDQRVDLDHVPDARRRAVTFDHRRGRRRNAGIGPRPPHREDLTNGIGGRDALALAVARTTGGAHDGVDAIAVALGVFEPFEQEDRGALAHHEAVGPVGVGPGAGGRQRADLAELHIARRAHVRVDAAGEHRVEVVMSEAIESGRHRGHGRGAGRVGHEIGSVQVEERRDASGDDVRQLAGHRVFVDRRETAGDAQTHLFEHGGALRVRQAREARRFGQLVGELGPHDAGGGEVMLIARHRVTDDDRRSIAIERPIGPVVGQRLPGGADPPPLGAIHALGHLGRDGQTPLERLPVILAHEPADPRVRLVGRDRIRIPIQVGIPSTRRHLADAVATGDEVLPEGSDIRCVGEHGADADDGGRCARGMMGHEGVPGSESVGWGLRRGRTARRRRRPCRR